MAEDVNYILHLNNAFGKMIADERLNPFHISLYFSLFQFWNLAKFRNPISINREEMMRASKIGSANTYTKCIKDLHNWGYINYIPSHSPYVGSKIHLYNFDKTNNKTAKHAAAISTDKTGTKTSKKAMRPSINSLNKTNKPKPIKQNEHKRTKNNRKSFDSSGGRIKKEMSPAFADTEKKQNTSRQKSSCKKERIIVPAAKIKKPSFRQVKTHFATQQWPPVEAEKFFNYFQSNGWLVGGKTPMKNWKAAAKNWMLNAEIFKSTKTFTASQNTSSNKLHTKTDKDYAEPL